MHVYAKFFSLSLNEPLGIKLSVLFGWDFLPEELFARNVNRDFSGTGWWEVFS